MHCVFFQEQYKMCIIYPNLARRKGPLDFICINSMTTGLLTIRWQIDNRASKVHLKYNNGTCIKPKNLTYDMRCMDRYAALSVNDEERFKEAKGKCFDSIQSNEDFMINETHSNIDATIRIADQNEGTLVCEVNCASFNVEVNILQIIEDVLIKVHENTRRINIPKSSYEYSGTYICQISFEGNRQINGTEFTIDTKGMYNYSKMKMQSIPCHETATPLWMELKKNNAQRGEV